MAIRHCLPPWHSTAALAAAILAVGALHADEGRLPTVKVSSASRLALPGEIDSSNPLVWDMVDGEPRLFVLTSWGGVPIQSAGTMLERLQLGQPAIFDPHPGHGVWLEAIVPDGAGAWYGYYHHERPADECGRNDRQLPNIGALRSTDRGRTWAHLGIVIDAPPGSNVCESGNRFVFGGVGDVTAALDHDQQNLYLYFSQYTRGASTQGVAVARLAWADRDEPVGKVSIWNDGAWLPVSRRSDDAEAADAWVYPAGTPLVPATRPFHDASSSADVFWGPSIHWNTYLEQYVMLLNRARDEHFDNEGIYVSFAPVLGEPRRWSAPRKIMNDGEWYPQVVGLELGSGTDRLAGKRARLFITGKSQHMIEFER